MKLNFVYCFCLGCCEPSFSLNSGGAIVIDEHMDAVVGNIVGEGDDDGDEHGDHLFTAKGGQQWKGSDP